MTYVAALAVINLQPAKTKLRPIKPLDGALRGNFFLFTLVFRQFFMVINIPVTETDKIDASAI